ncbi:MAG: TetR/AcrR family transcriptional regulator [Myxococcota bacterium]
MSSPPTSTLLSDAQDRPGRRERRKREVRQRIYDCARALFLENGVANTTVEQIAAAADVVPATFFNHFQSKQALLGLLAGEVVDAIEVLIAEHFPTAGSTREQLEGFARAAAEQIAANRGLARDVVLELMRKEASPEHGAPYLERVYEPVEALIEVGQQRGEVRSDWQASFLAQMVVGILNSAVTRWLGDPSYPIDEQLPEAARFAWQAIRAQTAPSPQPPPGE